MDFLEILYLIPGVVIGFSLHEYAHAQVAVWLGDDTPRLQGRLTTSPFAHIDIIGFLMIIFAGFGWAKPVQVNPNNFKNRSRDDILVSLAGPLMNLIIAILTLIFIKIFLLLPINFLSESLFDIIIELLDYMVWINIVLFVFNLLPIPPLDGSHIFFGLLGLKNKDIYHKLYQHGRLLLPVLVISGLTSSIILPPIKGLYNILLNIFFGV